MDAETSSSIAVIRGTFIVILWSVFGTGLGMQTPVTGSRLGDGRLRTTDLSQRAVDKVPAQSYEAVASAEHSRKPEFFHRQPGTNRPVAYATSLTSGTSPVIPITNSSKIFMSRAEAVSASGWNCVPIATHPST